MPVVSLETPARFSAVSAASGKAASSTKVTSAKCIAASAGGHGVGCCLLRMRASANLRWTPPRISAAR
eukprot:4620884-Lingulodinium_polyedra.AAC.1